MSKNKKDNELNSNKQTVEQNTIRDDFRNEQEEKNIKVPLKQKKSDKHEAEHVASTVEGINFEPLNPISS